MKIGGSDIAAMYAGSSDVSKAYIGSEIVWQKQPYDSRVEYLEGTGNQYIDTGILPSKDVELLVDLQITQLLSGGRYIFGRYASSQRFYLYVVSSAKYEFGWSSTSKTSSVTADTGRHKFRLFSESGTSYLYIDGVEVSNLSTSEQTATYTTTIFRGGTGYINYGTPQKIYGCTMYRSGNVILDLIPVRVGQTGYMYDQVSGQLFGNDGTDDFLFGNDIN